MDGQAISPELVLVYPEMREQAIALLPDFGWQTFVARTRAQAQAQTQVAVRDDVRPPEPLTATALASLGTWMVIAFTGASFLTLALTVVADALR